MYHDQKGGLPSGYTTNLAPDNSDLGPGWGWATYLLEYLEQDNLRKQIRFDLPISDPANAQVRITTVPTFVCPSEPKVGTFSVVDSGGNPICDVARGSYVAMNGVLGVSGDA